PLGEDQRRGISRAHPAGERRLERHEQALVHRVADEQRIHVRAAGHVSAARGRAVQEQRDETTAKGLRHAVRELLGRELRHQNLPPAPPPEKPPPPPKPPNPPLNPPAPTPPAPEPPPPPPPPPPRRPAPHPRAAGHPRPPPPAA